MHQRLIPLFVALILAGCSPSANYAVSPLSPPKVYTFYMPQTWVYHPATPTPRPMPTSTPKPTCYRTAQAAEFARLLAIDTRQRRKSLHCNYALVQAAQVRAESLARLGYFAHCDPNGICPNAVAIASGCRLPAWYAPNGNNVESLTAGTGSPKAAFDSLARSPSHAKHIFGQVDFFREQTEIGIAYVNVPGSKYTFYWAIEIAICGGGNNG